MASFDGGAIASDAGALPLGTADRAVGPIDRFASCFVDHRRPALIEHAVATLVRQRVVGLDLTALRATRRVLAAGAALKLLGLPLLACAACAAFGVEGPARGVAVLWSALPTAPSAYILARQLGGDAALMAGLLTASTLAAFLTMSLVLGLLA